jgi:hypothetical protein
MRNLLLVLFLAGCAEGAAINPEIVDPSPDLPVESICGISFVPDPELLEATEIAAARWSAATGCSIQTGEGIPIYAHDRLYAVLEPSREICGLATWSENNAEVIRLDISLSCDVEDATAHEVGHAIAGLKGHSRSGVMASGHNENRTPVIDTPSLELVCYLFPCLLFNPEI